MLDGAVSIEDVLNRIIGTKDKNYNSYWHAFDEYYDETQKDVEYPKEKNKEEIEIVNKKFEREADVDEEDDEEELKENEDRLALQNYYEYDDEESVMLEIKEQKIDLTNVKHLHQSEFIYIVHHYNVCRKFENASLTSSNINRSSLSTLRVRTLSSLPISSISERKSKW